jgi:threonylcarbamoyladenosine tRNA methylthiotransferase MtaB
MRASLYTLGCRLNQAETGIIAKTLIDKGFEIVEWGEPSDLAVVNTCTVTEKADSKCRNAVRKAIRTNPDAFIAVVGCYSQIAAKLISEIEGVDLVLGNAEKLNVAEYIDGLKKSDSPTVICSRLVSRDDFAIESIGTAESHARANLKIQDGCDFVCSFCIIPRARGRSRSRALPDLLREAHDLADSGFKEIILTGVNIGTYESDGHDFLGMIRELEEIDGIDRIRISSIELTTIGKPLVRHMAESEKLCPHLHIPLQSGDDRILELMARKHTAADYARFVEYCITTVPDIGIGTDILVGFPGETDHHFRNTKKFVADLPLEYFHVFSYSDRKGTPASRMSDKIDPDTRKLRSRILIEMGERKRFAFYEQYIGKPVDVLFESVEDGHWIGFTGNYMRVRTVSAENLRNITRGVLPENIDGEYLAGHLI